ncbi:DoxX family protein [Chitinophaga niabensis]|uniref:DoxX family protein n=1 Tax=Chitinophaga niabensis TaxID=536979 RepID=UPI0031B9F28F
MLQTCFSTDNGWTGLILRLTLGIVLFPHGAQKMFGWFGGPGFSGEMHHLTQQAGLPAFVAVLVILIEFFAALMLITGAGSRIAAVAVIGLFIGIIWYVHASMGFFMNWFGTMPAGHEGYEYHLLIIGLAIALVFTGSGRFSIDRLIFP